MLIEWTPYNDTKDDFSIEISMKSREINVTFTLEDPRVVSSNEFQAFVDDFSNGEENDLTFFDSKGVVIMGCQGSVLSIHVSKEGCGGGGKEGGGYLMVTTHPEQKVQIGKVLQEIADFLRLKEK